MLSGLNTVTITWYANVSLSFWTVEGAINFMGGRDLDCQGEEVHYIDSSLTAYKDDK